jgi:diguanylate cyclase (GGDEF)-like protein
VLALRTLLWGHVAALPELEGDAAQLLLLQTRVSEVLDVVLRATVDAYVEEAQRVLRNRATRDALTGLLNRAAFEEALHHEVSAVRRESPPTLLLIDLDGFKQVNDTLGHLAGDDVLVRVSRLIEAGVRRSDLVARLGGDEFAVLLPRTTAARAKLLARRLLSKVAATTCSATRPRRSGSASAWPACPTPAPATSSWPRPTRPCTRPSAAVAPASRSARRHAPDRPSGRDRRAGHLAGPAGRPGTPR